MYRTIVKLRFAAILMFATFACSLYCQETTHKTVNRSTLVGVGKSKLIDTYLSPLKYTGTNISILTDRLSEAGFMSDKLLLQQQFGIDVSFTKNPAYTASEYYGNVYYKANTFYPLLNQSGFRLLAGGGIEAGLGGIYNMRNSNNPGSVKSSINLDLSAMALYRLKNLTFRWQLTTPFLGMFFSPAYGQSYYEIFSLGNVAGTVQLASFNNYLALQNYMTVDIPIKNITFRTGYLGNYYKTNVNDIVTKINLHQFVFGFAVESLSFGGVKSINNKFIESSFY